ncbi:MAG: endolytic transglycosylase MltG, partial [Firmicutes bacterium]|nr:endolytic transglycosylase MltG [Bacillota bacterium]
LLAEFQAQYSKVVDMLPDGMTMSEAITIASLVEREAKLDSERDTISGVIQNRLDIDMILQIDASVVYAISDGLYDVERVLYKDLEVDSPYNTYKYKGLPVGPICNPGIESIRAAMNPEDHKYLYYHTDTEKNDGSHIFSETYSQHTK